jgi:MYXO-CTERM domain-containing protein
MRRLLSIAFALVAMCAPLPAFAASTTLVISEFRTRGPNGANDEFIEIFNISNATVNAGGFSVMASDSSGATVQLAKLPANTNILSRHYYLLSNNGTQGYSGTTGPNAVYSIGIPDDGGIAVLNGTGTVVDAVGMSSTSAYKESTPLAPLTSNVIQSYERNNGGCAATQDTDNNSADFRLNALSAGPQNSSYNCNTCAGVVCNAPPTACYKSPGTCSTGTCTYTPLAVGAVCSDGNACTVGDMCDAQLSCVSGAVAQCTTPPASFCSDAKTLVTYASSGTCSTLAGCSYPSTSQNCPFGCNGTTKLCNPDPCTSVSCNTAPNDCYQPAGTCTNGSCVYQPRAATTPCSDANACTTGDTCDGSGKCVAGAAVPIDDSNVCTFDKCESTTGSVSHTPVTDGTNCDDGDHCNGTATCQSGTCANSAAVTCTTPPIGGCYSATGICNPANGICSYQPLAPEVACDDGQTCTTSDECDGNGSCGGSAVICPPDSPTCADAVTSRTFSAGSCQAASGACTVVPSDKQCDFGCDMDSGLCKGDPCTGKICNQPPSGKCYLPTGTCSGGQCSYTLTAGAECDDGDKCTGGDTCSAAGACVGTPLACNTPPLAKCTADKKASIHPDVTGTCSNAVCDYATTEVPCSFGCNDTTGLCNGDPCATVTCDAPPSQCHVALGTCTAGQCSYELKPANADCDDGDPCTVSDVCSATGACAGGAKSCNTPPAPTCASDTSLGFNAAGTCEKATGTCAYTQHDKECAVGCDSTTGLCKGDPCAGIACDKPPSACYLEKGTCTDGKCDYAPLATSVACDDGDKSTENDACDGKGKCAGTPPMTGGSGGATGAGGTIATGGTIAAGGKAGQGMGGQSGSGDAGVAPGPDAGEAGSGTVVAGGGSSGSCGCSVPRSTSGTAWPLGLLAFSVLTVRRRRRQG